MFCKVGMGLRFPLLSNIWDWPVLLEIFMLMCFLHSPGIMWGLDLPFGYCLTELGTWNVRLLVFYFGKILAQFILLLRSFFCSSIFNPCSIYNICNRVIWPGLMWVTPRICSLLLFLCLVSVCLLPNLCSKNFFAIASRSDHKTI